MGTISTEERKKTATIVEHEGGETKYRFPMPDKAHARNALARLNQAKGLSEEEKSKIKKRAEHMLHKKGTYDKGSVEMAMKMRRE